MTALIDGYLWCVLQVTMFSIVGAVLYWLLRKRSLLRAALPNWCLATIAALSLLAAMPLSGWSWLSPPAGDAMPHQVSVELTITEHGVNRFLPQETNDARETTLPMVAPVETVMPNLSTLEGTTTRRSSIENTPSPPSTNYDVVSKRAFLMLAGVAFVIASIRLLLAWRELRKRIRASELIVDDRIQNEFTSLRKRYHLSQPVILRETSAEHSPATVGWRRPSILLPRSWREWSPEQRRAVLAHELAHIEHHDYMAWLAAQLPLLLHSYHPLVHWFARKMRWEQEIAADRRAIEVVGDRESYLAALAELALHRTASPEYSLVPTSSQLLRRLKMLRENKLDGSQSVSPLKRLYLFACLCAVALAVSGLRENASAEPSSDTDRPTSRAHNQTNEPVTVSALVMISPHPATNDENNVEVYWETQLALIKSQFILQSALGQPQVAESEFVEAQANAGGWLAKRLVVERIPDSPVLRLQLTCPPAHTAACIGIVDAVIESFKREVGQQQFSDNDHSQEMRGKLAKLHKELNLELREKIKKYQDLASELDGAESPIAQAVLNMLINEVRQIQGQIIQKQDELVEIGVNRALAEQQAKSATALRKSVRDELNKDPMLANYVAEEFAILQQIRALRAMNKQEQSEEIERLEQARRLLKREENEYRAQAELEIRKTIKAAPNDFLDGVMTEYILRRDAITADVAKLEAALEEKVAEIEQKGERSADLTMLHSEIDQLQEIEREMEHKLRNWDLTNQSVKSHRKAVVLMPATVTGTPVPAARR